jgi:hypothetical protein
MQEKNVTGRDNVGDLGIDGRSILKGHFMWVWNGFIWMKTETRSGLL